MKKAIMFILAFTLAMFSFSSPAMVEQETEITIKASKVQQNDVDKENGIFITKEYRWITKSWGSYEYNYGVSFVNKTGYDCGVDAQIVFFDAENNIVGIDNFLVQVVGNGAECFIRTENDIPFNKVICHLNPVKTIYKEINSIVDISFQVNDKKVFLFAENTGKYPAEFVEYTCIFMKEDSVVGYERGYLTDSDSEIKPGNVEMEEIKCSKEFDAVDIYIEGRYYD